MCSQFSQRYHCMCVGAQVRDSPWPPPTHAHTLGYVQTNRAPPPKLYTIIFLFTAPNPPCPLLATVLNQTDHTQGCTHTYIVQLNNTTTPTHTHTHYKNILWTLISDNVSVMHMRVCLCGWHADPHTRSHTGSSENTYILLLSLMDEEMLMQTNKQTLCSKLELSLSRSRPDASSNSAPPSYPLFLFSSGPTWLSACFPWRLPASVPRLRGGRWKHSLRHILSTSEGWGPLMMPSVHWASRETA